MTLAEALERVAAGEKVRCDALPIGTVLKREPRGWDWSGPRTVWEATGDGFDFTPKPEHEVAEWSIVAKGWGDYAA